MSTWEESSGEEWKGERLDDAFIEIFRKLAEALNASPEERMKSKLRMIAEGNTYILEKEIFKKVKNLKEFSAAFDMKNRRIALDKFDKGTCVSTVFLALDHNFSGVGGPVLFETLAAYKGEEYEMRRYSTVEQALTGHNEIVDQLKLAVRNNL